MIRILMTTKSFPKLDSHPVFTMRVYMHPIRCSSNTVFYEFFS